MYLVTICLTMMATLGDEKDGGKSVQISGANNASNFTLIVGIGFCGSATVLKSNLQSRY